MPGARLCAGVLAVSIMTIACADGDTVGPTLTPEIDRSSKVLLPPIDGPIDYSSQGSTEVVGCHGDACAVDENTQFLVLLAGDALAVDAFQAVRTPADLSFVLAPGAPGTDTVPVGPVPGPVTSMMKRGAGDELASFLTSRGFVVPTDTVPTGPFIVFRIEDGEAVEAAMIMIPQDLARRGVLSRSQSDAKEVDILWTRGAYEGFTLNTMLPPTDTVPVGPGPAPARLRGGK